MVLDRNNVNGAFDPFSMASSIGSSSICLAVIVVTGAAYLFGMHKYGGRGLRDDPPETWTLDEAHLQATLLMAVMGVALFMMGLCVHFLYD
jgi:hypothetical protein